jgi:hypothetical protein
LRILGQSRRRKYLIEAAAILLIVFGSAIVHEEFLADHPTDETLIASFQKHRSQFDQLALMAKRDVDVSTIYSDPVISPDYRVAFTDYRSWPKRCPDCFSTERWNDYQSIFATLDDLKPFRISKTDGMLEMPVSFQSKDLDDLEYIVSEKGFAYSETEPPGLVESLNGMGVDTEGPFFKKIDGYWYLYHTRGFGKPE